MNLEVGKLWFSSDICRNKRETKSYFEIYQSLGVDSPSQILFITDVFQEAVAAKNAGDDQYNSESL
jgi:methionine salvage enolase-phosphatase E1